MNSGHDKELLNTLETVLQKKFTPSYIAICRYLLYHYKKVINSFYTGIPYKIFPSNKVIAAGSKVFADENDTEGKSISSRTVIRFKTEYKNILLTMQARFRDKLGANPRRSSDNHFLNLPMFECLFLLEEQGILRKLAQKRRNEWNTKRGERFSTVVESVMKKYYFDGPWFIHRNLVNNHKVLENPKTRSFYTKLDSMKEYIKLHGERPKDKSKGVSDPGFYSYSFKPGMGYQQVMNKNEQKCHPSDPKTSKNVTLLRSSSSSYKDNLKGSVPNPPLPGGKKRTKRCRC
jgi:hypothetical protein